MVPFPKDTKSVVCPYCDEQAEHMCAKAAWWRHGWDVLLKSHGAFGAQAKLNKLEAYRLYDRKYPYDVAGKSLPIDTVYDLSTGSPDPLEQMIMDEARDEWLAKLTPRQQEDAKLYEQGYKPRDIAKMRGKDSSNAERWQKHNMKERLSSNDD